MSGRMDGKVVLITGAARGQGRSHAVRLAEEGADVIAVDSCAGIDTVAGKYPLATPEDLDETVAEVETTGRRIVARQADVRDPAALDAAVAAGVDELGGLDAVVANAGIAELRPRLGARRGHLAGHDRRQPDRRLAHRQGRDPAPGRRRARRVDGVHHLDRRAQGHPAGRALRLGQARHRRADAHAGQRARPVPHPGQHGPPDERRHPHDPEPGDLGDVRARRPGARRRRRRSPASPR